MDFWLMIELLIVCAAQELFWNFLYKLTQLRFWIGWGYAHRIKALSDLLHLVKLVSPLRQPRAVQLRSVSLMWKTRWLNDLTFHWYCSYLATALIRQCGVFNGNPCNHPTTVFWDLSIWIALSRVRLTAVFSANSWANSSQKASVLGKEEPLLIFIRRTLHFKWEYYRRKWWDEESGYLGKKKYIVVCEEKEFFYFVGEVFANIKYI